MPRPDHRICMEGLTLRDQTSVYRRNSLYLKRAATLAKPRGDYYTRGYGVATNGSSVSTYVVPLHI